MAGKTGGAPAARGRLTVAASTLIDIDVTLRRPGFTLSFRLAGDFGALALFGRSGSGKSTVLGLIAGLLRPDSGHIRVGGVTLVDTAQRVFVAPHRRRVGLVFQDSALFPHFDVLGNLRYAARFGRSDAGGGEAERTGLALDFDEVVGLLGLAPLLGRRPATLSGGERQRVAIGRALLSAPRLLLFDEPLASLDAARKLEILPYILRLREQAGVPIVYVSHAADEVARVADAVAVIDAGSLQAIGPPGEVLAPAWARGAGGFTAVSVIEARVRDYDEAYGLTLFDHPAGMIALPGRIGRPGEPHRFVIRATDVALAVQRPRDVSFRTVLSGTIESIERDPGPIARIDIRLPGDERIVALITRKAVDDLAIDTGDRIFAMVKATALDERSLAR